jgi:hypothetical protein
MGGEDALVARPEVGVRDEAQELVGARAANDAVRVEAVAAADGAAQRAGRAVGIARKLGGGGAVGGERARARAERRLVGGELDRLDAAGQAALARHVGLDVEDAGPRRRGARNHSGARPFSQPSDRRGRTKTPRRKRAFRRPGPLKFRPALDAPGVTPLAIRSRGDLAGRLAATLNNLLKGRAHPEIGWARPRGGTAEPGFFVLAGSTNRQRGA